MFDYCNCPFILLLVHGLNLFSIACITYLAHTKGSKATPTRGSAAPLADNDMMAQERMRQEEEQHLLIQQEQKRQQLEEEEMRRKAEEARLAAEKEQTRLAEEARIAEEKALAEKLAQIAFAFLLIFCWKEGCK